MSDLAMIIARKAAPMKPEAEMGPSMSEMRDKACLACAHKLIKAIKDDDARGVLMALDDLERMSEDEEEASSEE